MKFPRFAGWAAGALLLLACTSTPSATAPASEQPVAPANDEPPAAAADPEAAEPEAAVAESPAVAEPQRWRFTTLVTGGPESLVGANGYYELDRYADRIVVRKVGQKGTPRFEEARVLEGSAPLAMEPDPAWPDAVQGSVAVTIANDDRRRDLRLDLWISGDELHGAWSFPHPPGADKPTIGRAWGLLSGVRDAGEPAALANGDGSPCVYCNRAFFNCEGMGEGGCNSSDQGMTACAERMRDAAAKRGAIPRGCGDWM